MAGVSFCQGEYANVDGLPRDCKRRLVASSENFFHPPVHYGDASFE